MNREERERMVDRLLDTALQAESVEPRPGLEERILANLRAQRQPRPWWRWAWAPALVAAMAFIVVGIATWRGVQHTPAASNSASDSPAQVNPTSRQAANAEPAAAAALQLHKQVRDRHQAMTHQAATSETVALAQAIQPTPAVSMPRQETFPSTTPLTEPERLLLAFVNQNREDAVLMARVQQVERQRAQEFLATGEAPTTPSLETMQ